MNGAAPVAIDRAADRFRTRIGWLDSWHSFSFGSHYDPLRVGHGLLIVSNDDQVQAGAGFGPHPHRDMEIVTWVLEGALEHQDSSGNSGVLQPGVAQHMSAGTGVTHSEMNASATEPVHFVQMWVVPGTDGVEPVYNEVDFNAALARGGLVAVASGKGHDGALALNQPGATMWVARMGEAETVILPDANFVHLFVAAGAGVLGDTPLVGGDAARLTGAGPVTFTATDNIEIIVWESDSSR